MRRKKFLKRVAHKRVRRSSLPFGKGNIWNRLYDYQWAVD